jgi:hypothetical protein
MKKAYQIIDVILALGLMFSVVVAGRGGGNDTNELKVKNGTTTSNSSKSKSYQRCTTAGGITICTTVPFGQ